MKKLLEAIVLVAIASVSVDAGTIVGTYPVGGGQITISTDGPVDAAGLDFVSDNESLIPIPIASSQGAEPFDFLLANNALQVRLGNLLEPVTLDGSIVLGVGAMAGASIEASWMDGNTPMPFDVIPIPEPSTAVMAMLLLPLLGARRRRRR